MYPHDIIPGINLYVIMIVVGLLGAFIVLRLYLDKKFVSPRIQNFYLVLTAVSILVGFISANFFQALYDFIETGKFSLKNAGITFLGGLIGGTATFLSVTFYNVRRDEELKKSLPVIFELAPCAICLAHALGRLGCFFAGCCYGEITDSVFGVKFYGESVKRHPTQLYEAIFLFIMFAVTSFLYFKDYRLSFVSYLMGYGLFRFIIEYLRDDYRGSSLVSFLTPSQFISILMIALGAGLLYVFFVNRQGALFKNSDQKKKKKDKNTLI